MKIILFLLGLMILFGIYLIIPKTEKICVYYQTWTVIKIEEYAIPSKWKKVTYQSKSGRIETKRMKWPERDLLLYPSAHIGDIEQWCECWENR